MYLRVISSGNFYSLGVFRAGSSEAGALPSKMKWWKVIQSRFVRSGIAAIFLLTSLPLASPGAAQDPSAPMDRYLRAQVAANQFSGSILVARNDRVLWSKAYGPRTAKSATSNPPKTRFRLGSIAVQFTDLAILQLQEKNGLQVRDSVCKYITECPQEWETITLFDLMVHTSGLPEVAIASGYGRSRLTPPTIAELVRQIKSEPLRFNPGETVEDSYSEDEVLDAVIEAVSGEPYTTYLARHIFIPLGMHHTGYDRALRLPALPGSLPRLMPSDIERSLFYTAGGLYSTVEDLYLWDRALRKDKAASPQSLEQMTTPYRDGYGFGWKVRKELDRRLLTQGGGLSSYSNSILRFPDDDAFVVVLSDSETTDAARVGRDLAAILFSMQYELPVKHKIIKLDPASYDDFVGRYALTPNFILAVTKEGDRLMIQGTGQAKTELLSGSETQFFTSGSSATIHFVKIPGGRVTQIILQQGGRDIPVARVQ
jgi:CubicO group peptidase (beta-lactamase class C family)